MKNKKSVSGKNSEKSVSKKHHAIPKQILLIPGILLLISIMLLIFKATEWAYLFVGIAIVIAILIHKDEN